MFYSLSVWPPSVTSLTPSQSPKASPEAAPMLQLVWYGMCNMWGSSLSPACCCSALGAALTKHCSLHTVIFLPRIYEMQLKEPQVIFTNFYSFLKSHSWLSSREEEFWASISSFGWGNMEVWLIAYYTPSGIFSQHESLFLKSAGDQMPKGRYNLSIDAMLENFQIEIRYQSRRTFNFHKFSILSAGSCFLDIWCPKHQFSHLCRDCCLDGRS